MKIPPFQTMADWLQWIEMQSTQWMHLDLTHVRRIWERLQKQSFSMPVITIAGTNGKGSTVACLEQIYLAAGYRTGSYTSPHLLHFNERIKLNGKPVNETDICRAFAAIFAVKADDPLTYFEFATLAALWLFQEALPDVLILEIGLGGRLDAVNIIDPDVSVITQIDFDHTEWLGETLAQIGLEKAGIMRPQKPVVIGDPSVPQVVLEKAMSLEAPCWLMGREFDLDLITEEVGDIVAAIKPSNVAISLITIHLLQARLPVSVNAKQAGLRTVSVSGRFETLIATPVHVIVDVAHNASSVKWLREQLTALPMKGRCLAVFSMLTDKAIQTCIQQMISCVTHWFVAPLGVSRGVSAPELQKIFSAAHIVELTWADTISEAFMQAWQYAQPGDTIIVFGSFYTVGAVLQCVNGAEFSKRKGMHEYAI